MRSSLFFLACAFLLALFSVPGLKAQSIDEVDKIAPIPGPFYPGINAVNAQACFQMNCTEGTVNGYSGIYPATIIFIQPVVHPDPREPALLAAGFGPNSCWHFCPYLPPENVYPRIWIKEWPCPPGYRESLDNPLKCVRPSIDIAKFQECDETTGCGQIGNPINMVARVKTEVAVDFRSPQGKLEFARYYSSAEGVPVTAMPLGPKWRHTYSRFLKANTDDVGAYAYLFRPSGNMYVFKKQASGVWKSDVDVKIRVEEIHDSGSHIGWLAVDADGTRESYALDGTLSRIEWQDGAQVSLSYVEGNLSKVMDENGRSISFFYTGSTLTSVGLPDGSGVTYGYTNSRLTSAGFVAPGETVPHATVTYVNELINGRVQLVGLNDESGLRYSTWLYDGLGDARVSVKGNPSGNIERISVVYNGVSSAVVTNALGQTSTHGLTTMHRKLKLTGATNFCQGCGGGKAKSITYDANGFPDVTVDWRNNTTDDDYDANGLLVKRATAVGTPFLRTISSTWDTRLRAPLTQTVKDESQNAVVTRQWTYNSRGQVLQESMTDVVTLGVRTSTKNYCEQGDVDAGTCPLLGLLTAVNGPRTDSPDTTTYAYYPSDDATCATAPTTCPHRKGDLWKVTNAKGQVTETLKYDGAGRVLSVKDPNGVITDFEYHPRGWLTASKVRGTNDAVETDDAITRIAYWPTGLVQRVTQPDGAFTHYTYDQAHRLTDITDNAGNTLHYTLDNASNRIAEETKDAGGTLKRTLSRIYNQLGQLATQADALAHPTDFTYDANGNLNTVTDALGRVTDNDHDPLDRLARTLQNVGGIAAETKFQYDALDNLTKVTDPKGLDTTYTYNGLGDLTQLQSPDTGTTTYTYDNAGNRASQTDARGVTTTYAYDVLNRLTAVSYPDSSLNVGYTYDTVPTACEAGETFSSGRLSGLDDASGSTRYCYNRFGHLVRKVQTTNGVSFVVRYAYTLAGNLQAMVYPDGTTVDYGRNAQGQVTDVGVTRNGQPRQVLLEQATYHPFGPVAGWAYGNGRTLTRTLDQDYRPLTIEDPNTGGLSLGFGYDAVGNLTKLGTAQGMAAPAIRFDYDSLGRLTRTEDGPTQAAIDVYAYDATGNRTAHTTAAGTSAYTYPTTSHRLTDVAGVARTYDAVGNTTAIGGTRGFAYNDASRMSLVQQSGVTTRQYAYNGRGEQVRRYLGTTNTYTVYDEAGHWLGDYDDTGAPVQQALWMDDLPVGLLANGNQLHYLQPDHLGSPRVVIEAVRNVPVWTWDLKGEAFGSTTPQQDPDGDGIPFVLDMRFPGQRYDAASALNQNYHRDYDASAGRYAQSDPIGLRAGWDKYSYVDSSPLVGMDIVGLVKVILFGPNDDPIFHQRANEYQDVPGECLVYSHGSPSFIYDTRSGNTKMIDDPKDIIEILTKNGCTKEMPVTFFSCRTGMGENSIAEQVSKEKFFPSVAGPTNYIWYNFDASAAGPTQIYGKNPGPSPNLEDPGVMMRFP
ncbi:RHS repeat-associated core domain-containing protein [Pseudoxanthomonas beigongshangi]